MRGEEDLKSAQRYKRYDNTITSRIDTTDHRAVGGKPINVWIAESAVVKHSGSF